MSLRTDITNLELHIVGQLALNSEVILSGILTAHVRLELSEQRVGAEHSPVHRLPTLRIKDAIDTGEGGQPERIGIREFSALVQKRLVEHCVEWECAPTEGGLSAELFEHELLNRVIEHSPPGSNTRLARSSRTPCDADSRSEGFFIRLCQTVGDTRVSRHDQADRSHRGAIGIHGVLTGINLAHF